MSCGKPHETDCAEVLAQVWLLLDRECDGQRRRTLEQHLDECAPCLEQYGLEEKLKLLLARKCGGEQASTDFKRRLLAALHTSVLEACPQAGGEARAAGGAESGTGRELAGEPVQAVDVLRATAELRRDVP